MEIAEEALLFCLRRRLIVADDFLGDRNRGGFALELQQRPAEAAGDVYKALPLLALQHLQSFQS